MRRVRKHPVLDEAQELRGRVAQLEKEKQELLVQLAEMESKVPKPTKPVRPDGVPDRAWAARTTRSAVDAFSALSSAFGNGDANRLLNQLSREGGLLGEGVRAEQTARGAATQRRRDEVEMFVRPGRTNYHVPTMTVPVRMLVTFGLPRNEAELVGELLIPIERFQYEDGSVTAADAVRGLSEHVCDLIFRSERDGSRSFSRF